MTWVNLTPEAVTLLRIAAEDALVTASSHDRLSWSIPEWRKAVEALRAAEGPHMEPVVLDHEQARVLADGWSTLETMVETGQRFPFPMPAGIRDALRAPMSMRAED